MTRTAVVIASTLLLAACAQPRQPSRTEPATRDTVTTEGSRTGAWTTAEIHHARPRPPAILVVVDSIVSLLDTTAHNRARTDSVLASLTNRVIARIEMYPPGDSTIVARYGSRAVHGVVFIDTRAARNGASPPDR